MQRNKRRKVSWTDLLQQPLKLNAVTLRNRIEYQIVVLWKIVRQLLF